ncbi:uncharacterized protein DMAD_04924 [Drosophila madeirensis]|uniref:Uncharacterized protein n=1 Tax=Drosophila madeirensis TaxID=30013 RepID=A0AAU9GE34_DROMD
MNPKLYFIYFTLMAELLLLSHLLFVDARSVSSVPTQQQTFQESSNSMSSSRNGNSTLSSRNSTSKLNQQKNSTTLSVSTDETAVAVSVSTAESLPSTVQHLRRKKRETRVDIPFDFFTNHMHCDFDQTGTYKILDFFPFTCIWLQNNRHHHEGWFRIYMQAQMEAFFFGQYYERLRRFELDPHTFDYRETEII